MDAEQAMLNRLADWFLIGLGLGGVLTVLAGLYLANQALRPIRRSWEQQRRFTADASHELRMPLSIIQANAELMLMHPDRSALEHSEQISMVLAEAKRMAELTDAALLARSDSGREELLLGDVRLDQLIRHVMRLFEPLAELNGVRLEAELASGVELTGDPDKLQQLLVILLDNSLKHTPAGGAIRVALPRRGQQAVMVVEDTGDRHCRGGFAAHFRAVLSRGPVEKPRRRRHGPRPRHRPLDRGEARRHDHGGKSARSRHDDDGPPAGRARGKADRAVQVGL